MSGTGSRTFATYRIRRRTHGLQNHFVDFGIDYGDGRSFSFARYYTVSFSTGLSALRNGSDTFFRVDGSVTLARRIARTWSASIGAARGTSYILGFSDPIYTDSVNAAFGGQIAQRLNFSTGANYVRGQNAFSSASGTLISKSASARLTFGLNQHLGLYGQASYYQYRRAQWISSPRSIFCSTRIGGARASD